MRNWKKHPLFVRGVVLLAFVALPFVYTWVMLRDNLPELRDEYVAGWKMLKTGRWY